MKTFIVNKGQRMLVSFYMESASGRTIKFVLRGNTRKDFNDIFNCDVFNLMCIQSVSPSYNLYKNCRPIRNCRNITRNTEKAELNILGGYNEVDFMIFECEKIVQNVSERDMIKIIRNEKLRNISNL